MKNKKGFTIIELMIVVVVLGVLAAIAIANFMSMQERAREASVKSNMHTTQLAVEDYNVSNVGNYPHTVNGFVTFLPHAQGTNQRGFVNPFTDIVEIPLDGDGTVLSTGQVSFMPIYESNGTMVEKYSIFGYGKDGILDLILSPQLIY